MVEIPPLAKLFFFAPLPTSTKHRRPPPFCSPRKASGLDRSAVEEFREMLQSHGVSTGSWGKGGAKSVEHLFWEAGGGAFFPFFLFFGGDKETSRGCFISLYIYIVSSFVLFFGGGGARGGRRRGCGWFVFFWEATSCIRWWFPAAPLVFLVLVGLAVVPINPLKVSTSRRGFNPQ